MNKDITKQVETFSPIEMAGEVVALQKQEKELKERLKNFRMRLLNLTKTLDVITLKTGDYTISRAKRKYVKVNSKKLLEKELKAREVPLVYCLDMDYMKPAVKQLADELDSVDVGATEYISIRVNK